MAEEIMREEINKHTETVISRLDETRSKLKEDLQYNQKVWNDLLHGQEWDERTCELSCQYIKAMCVLTDAINKLSQIKLTPDKK